MPRNSLSDKTMELQSYLLTAPRTQKEIAEHFGVDRKTVRRAIDRLDGTYLITEEKDGRNVVYTISKINFRITELTPIELAALILSKESLAAGGKLAFGSPFAEAGRSLIEKVRKGLPARVRKNLDELSNILGTAVVPNKDYSKFGTVIEELTAAALQRRVVLMTYAGLKSGEITERRFAPYNIYLDPDGATLKTIGHDYKNSRTSPFSLDHIRKIRITKETFVRPKDFELGPHLEERCFNGIHGDPVTVRLRATGTTARIFAERSFHTSQKTLAVKRSREKGIEQIDIEMTVAGGRGLERFILSWLPEIEVLEPASIRADIDKILTASRR